MKTDNGNPDAAAGRERRRRVLESTATFGLLLLAIGLVAPFTSIHNHVMVSVFKWIFGAGALIYTVARIAGGSDPGDSMRLRRLHRLEVWAGIAFCVATFFWFYNTSRFPYGLTLGVLRDTVLFTLVGALIQIIASWMMVAARRKEQNKPGSGKKKQ